MIRYLRLLKDILKISINFFFNKEIDKKTSLKYFEIYRQNFKNKDKAWQYLIDSFNYDSSNFEIFSEIYKNIQSDYFNNKKDLLRIYLSNNLFDLNYLLKYCKLFLKKESNNKNNIYVEYASTKEEINDNNLIDNSVNWLVTCQKNSKDRGICTGFDLKNHELTNSFPETTGYIIPTLVEFSKLNKRDSIYNVSVEMGDWIIDLIKKDGGLGEPYGFFKPYPRIFTTAQAILGLLSLYETNSEKRYLNAANKLGDFLLNNLANDGSWNKKYTFLHKTTTYKTRVSWIIMLLYKYNKKNNLKKASIKSLKYILDNETEKFWPLSCTFERNKNALTHLLGYHLVAIANFAFSQTIEDKILNDKLNDHVNYFYQNLNILLDRKKNLSGVINEKFENIADYTCLTGSSQVMFFALLYEKYYRLKSNLLSEKIYNTIFDKQIKSKIEYLNGAIGGSHPIDGDYAPYMLPSWASKFFVDSLFFKNYKNINFTFLG